MKHPLIKDDNGTPVPYSLRELRQDNPDTSFPRQPSDAFLAEWNVYRPAPTTPPSGDVVEESLPMKNGQGEWEQAWSVRGFTAAEQQERKEFSLNQKTQELKGTANERIEAGAPYLGTRWPADAESQLAKSSMAASIGAGRGLAKGRTTVTVRDLSRTKHDMTQSEYLDLAEAIRDYVVDIRETADNHIDALMALMADDTKTAGDVQAYDVTTGWPA